MTDKSDLERLSSQWFVGDLRYEGLISEKMSANFSLDSDRLPHHMVDLLGLLRDRERSSARESRDALNARPMLRREHDDQA